KTQGHIYEYRASSADGSRRKYYKITDAGKTLFEDEFASLFLDYDLIPVQQEKEETAKPQETQPEQDPYEDDVYIKYVKKVETLEEEAEIDFSSVKVDTVKDEPKPEELPAPTPVFDDINDEKPNEVDFDSVVSSNYEYRSVLNKLFPKSRTDFDEEDVSSYMSDVQSVPQEVVTHEATDNLNTLFEISEKENIKIRTSVDTNRYQGAKILDNKVRFHSAFIVMILAVIEFLLLTLVFSGSVHFSTKTLTTILVIFGAFTVGTGVFYLLNRSHSVKDLSKFINSLEIAIVLTIATMIISICVASIAGVDIYNLTQIFFYIIMPSVLAFNIPLYVFIVHYLSKLDFYQSI
ncbi:MAG: hypothetical protein J6V66_01480, partial [Clostridia bacterium]|nr:hypothetical protein [Clostridia bacterium]